MRVDFAVMSFEDWRWLKASPENLSRFTNNPKAVKHSQYSSVAEYTPDRNNVQA
jgi:hypothetical protein